MSPLVGTGHVAASWVYSWTKSRVFPPHDPIPTTTGLLSHYSPLSGEIKVFNTGHIGPVISRTMMALGGGERMVTAQPHFV